jgi:hypothetical protein
MHRQALLKLSVNIRTALEDTPRYLTSASGGSGAYGSGMALSTRN